MIVGKPELSESRDGVTVAATVQVDGGGRYPSRLFFAFPASVGGHVAARADAFAAALLPLAMHLGEPLTVGGALSSRLARGLREYQWFQAHWKPTIFRPVELRCDEVEDRDPGLGSGAVGTAFSGGVDSFHTLWTHLGEREALPSCRITHCLLINGFDHDTDLAGAGGFAAMQRLYEAMAERLGVRLVVARTNLLEFLGELLLKQSFAAFVTAPALALGTMFSRYYVPSSYRFTTLGPFPDGSHPMFDHLVGTETMETIHDGGHLTRVAKTITIAGWAETHDLLRVCFNATGVQPDRPAIANCCACEKCIRTMTTLDVAGALGDFRCFRKPLVRRDIRRQEYAHPGARVFAEEIIEYAARVGRRDVVRDLRFAIVNSVLYRHRLRELMLASYRLEQRSPRWAALARPTKRLVQRTGLFRGWLY